MVEVLNIVGQIVLVVYLVIAVLWGLACCIVTYLSLFTHTMHGFLYKKPEMYARVSKARQALRNIPLWEKLFWVPLAFIVCFISSVAWPYILLKK